MPGRNQKYELHVPLENDSHLSNQVQHFQYCLYAEYQNYPIYGLKIFPYNQSITLQNKVLAKNPPSSQKPHPKAI